MGGKEGGIMIENIKISKLGTPCAVCGKVDDRIAFPCKKPDGTSGVVCLWCIVEANKNKEIVNEQRNGGCNT